MKMMITREKAREITDKVVATKEDRAQKDAKNYVTAVLESVITRTAEQGCDNLTFHIPATIKDELVLAILRENDFTVTDARGKNTYRISW
jgi:hypothetical protein